ncbi:ATP-binding protein [candidate division KSB1 bacterium]|nr:ATP-binding protein [candidate division KSB1 bacterium]
MVDTKTRIGKDVIESLTLGMYEDARFIYREYIQNGADQIDKAAEEGILQTRDEGYIEIDIDKAGRKITIYDNATGIKAVQILSVLKNVAQSPKDREKHKGFRGIGRLGGLGYCDKLVFETSYEGEDVKSVLTWDAKLLKNIIHDRSKKEEAVDVIDKVTSFETKSAKSQERYFRVTLVGVTNDALLDKRNIIEYLSMVAPVPFNKGFIFSDQIHEELNKHGQSIDEYIIYVNNNQIFKAYTTSIYKEENGGKKKIDDINQLQWFTIGGVDGEFLGWGWYGISNYTGVIPKVNLARGLRLRKGNIQIGADNCLVKLFKEDRGSYYFFGEVHAFHKDLIPNARRDYFLENDLMANFEKQLKKLCRGELHNLYHFASSARNIQNKIDQLVEFQKEFKTKRKRGFTDKNEEQVYKEKFEGMKEKAESAEKELNKISENLGEDDTSKRKLFNRVTGGNKTKVEQIKLPTNGAEEKTKFLTDELSSLNRKEKKFLSKIFGVIDKVLPKELAENLKEKIKEDFK